MFTFTTFHWALVAFIVSVIWFLFTFLHLLQLQSKLDDIGAGKRSEVKWFMDVSSTSSLVFHILVIVGAGIVMLCTSPDVTPKVSELSVQEQVISLPIETLKKEICE